MEFAVVNNVLPCAHSCVKSATIRHDTKGLLEQMPKIMLKTLFGSAYIPTAATGSLFSDVSSSSFAANWIEELSNQSITEGCDVNNFCPKQTVTSEGFLQMMKQAYP